MTYIKSIKWKEKVTENLCSIEQYRMKKENKTD